jgi:hypothetical protein
MKTPPVKDTSKHPTKTEQDYVQIFSPHSLPYRGLYTEEDTLEQPSQLIYVPSTTTPSVT